MKTNAKVVEEKVYTHGGALASSHVTPMQQLRRAVLSCMLFEDEFYESGVTIYKRISALVKECDPLEVLALAKEARDNQHLRHVPLLLVREVARQRHLGASVGKTLTHVIQRADEIAEFLAIYWKEGRCPLSKQVKMGLAGAFRKFDTYQFAKYDRDESVKLRDALFLAHAKPHDVDRHYTKHERRTEAQLKAVPKLSTDERVYSMIVNRSLPTPDTWEVSLSGGADKKETFERLLTEGKLGYLALLRNLRNMEQSKVDEKLIKDAILARKGAHNVLPFRFLTAAMAVPRFEAALDEAMLGVIAGLPKLKGKTVFVVDISGSMHERLSAKSELNRMKAAEALAAVGREMCEEVVVYATAGNDHARIHATALVPARHGMALIQAIDGMYSTLGGGGIFLKQVSDFIKGKEGKADRVIVITDEQDCGIGHADSPENATLIAPNNYIVNVASAKNGIGYGKWTKIDGFSEAAIRFIHEFEAQSLQ